VTEQAPIRVISQTLGVDQVARVETTTPEQDPDSGLYIREVRVYQQTVVSGVATLVLTVRISGPTAEGVRLTTPELTY
jgi:hypothetical protein